MLQKPTEQQITVYATKVCPYCIMAEKLLKSKRINTDKLVKILVDTDPSHKVEMMELTGRRTVPQVYIGLTHIGGFDDLSATDKAGDLMSLLAPFIDN